ncbi:MAG: amidohydrolase family protein [Synergistaceae bacterium]|nr:amidohydrolase family protein [Synergistaceae bacterium]
MEQTQQEKISLVNGRIHTRTGTAKNITFEHGRIVSIDDESGGFSGRVIDLHGRTVLPGFCDCGLDFLSWAENQERLNLASVHSVQEFKDALGAYFHANKEPLRGWYIAYNIPDSVIISRDDIEEIVASLPCAVIDSNNTHIILNTPAMNELNMPQDNVEPDEFSQHLPPLTNENIKNLFKTYSPKLSALGISEVWSDFCGSESGTLWEIFSKEIYDSLNFRMRFNFGFADVNSQNDFLSSGLRTGDGLPFCKVGGILISGSLEQQEQKNMIYSAHLSGCQIIVDNNKSGLNALERVIKKVRKNSRHLVKNFSGGGLIERMKLLNLGSVAVSDMEADVIHEGFQNGVVVSGSSGANLTAPLKNIGRFVSNGLSVAEALNIYAWGAAWNGGNDLRRGELAVGNDADMIILEQDPFMVRPEEISLIDITATYTAGCVVYENN